ncbi:MAG: DUF3047 domain-containing protein [Granulosicoccus sp.]
MRNQLTSAALISSVVLFLSLATPQTQAATALVSDTPISEFPDTTLENWSERSFDGNTHYELIEVEGFRVLMAHTQKQASILYREETIDLKKTPVINWAWKVDRTYMHIDEQTRAGDDFPARLYVVAQVGFLPWETLAINYVWASAVAVGETWFNPFSDKAKMVAIQSGDTHVGKWTRHSRNVAMDFKTLFNQELQEIKGYAVMVDGDNAQLEATAWFGEITFNARSASTKDPM